VLPREALALLFAAAAVAPAEAASWRQMPFLRTFDPKSGRGHFRRIWRKHVGREWPRYVLVENTVTGGPGPVMKLKYKKTFSSSTDTTTRIFYTVKKKGARYYNSQ
jgi:hypothetical protein